MLTLSHKTHATAILETGGNPNTENVKIFLTVSFQRLKNANAITEIICKWAK